MQRVNSHRPCGPQVRGLACDTRAQSPGLWRPSFPLPSPDTSCLTLPVTDCPKKAGPGHPGHIPLLITPIVTLESQGSQESQLLLNSAILGRGQPKAWVGRTTPGMNQGEITSRSSTIPERSPAQVRHTRVSTGLIQVLPNSKSVQEVDSSLPYTHTHTCTHRV